MRCHKEKGILIPGCMGVAANMVGRSDRDAMSYCTCPPRKSKESRIDDLESKIEELSEQLKELKASVEPEPKR